MLNLPHNTKTAFVLLRSLVVLIPKRYSSWTDESGSGLVELAVTALLFFTVLFGIMECSRAVYVDLFLANSAREAVRYASVRGSSWPSNCASAASFDCIASSANVTSTVQSIASAGINSSMLNVSTAWPGTNATGASCSTSSPYNVVGCVVKVTVTYPFTFASPLLPHTTLTLTSTSEGSITQ